LKIADLPFHEKPIRELLALHRHHTREEALQYAGFGWTRADEIWLNDELVSNVLIIAIHADDDGEPLPDDIELAFELDAKTGEGVQVLLSKFLEVWLPKLPSEHTIVLAVCNRFDAVLKMPGPPLRYPMGDAFACTWSDRTPDICLEAETWCTLGS
jgi:hypothetical protein